MTSARRNGRVVGATLVVVLVVLALLGLWFRHTFHRVEKTLHLPPSGEAAYNPLYALAKTLEADGVKVNARQRLMLDDNALAAGDTLLLFNDPRALSPPEAERLLAWVEEGGHLLIRTPLYAPGEDTMGPDAPQSAMLDLLSAWLVDETPSCVDFQVEGEDHHVEFCRGRRFAFDGVVPELAWGDLQHGYVYARVAAGKGRVDVLADFDFMANTATRSFMQETLDAPPVGGLRDGPHRALARQVLAPNYRQGTMHLVYAAEMPSLWRTLFLRGWMVWAPLLLALAAWLWMRMQRFGPPLPSPAGERRSLLEHVRASGEHLYRYGRGVMLYSAVRQAFLARLRRRDPVAAALSGDAQVAAIADRTGQPADRIRTALNVPASHDRQGFRDRISLLIQLRNRL
ncbi:hypothetical protein J2X02_002992 [Pseudoxanthomonas japonensis]|uniref:DUF4350 domain-containing protein n=1 Tax=Pseudoxanthomonas japonensis TaxID=69284 RepID=UPI001E02C967|nr:DUF4350 domain-containing protein [Pseudoxanthomonas japonensis]MBA3928767.1 DUF4350 domain-containing protein [Xanthomonas sp.]MDR7070141.1 hypothetical protein [Pseudoxanthomonas japonensis]